jgi:DNA (cytosine-5)-methyltransferase 3A
MTETKKINVLSLFDGISCGKVALERVGFEIENYFASEIDKFAIKISQEQHPDIKQLGDVTTLDFNLFKQEIDLLIGGSPCQSFSVAGNGKGFDGKSGLFFDYLRILKEVKPKYFLLENVNMKKEWQDAISEELGVKPILINSNKLSAQDRKRLYWTNIANITQPEDKGFALRDIIENEGVDITDRMNLKKEGTLAYKKTWGNVRTLDQKAKTLTAGGQSIANSGATNVKLDNGRYKQLTPVECERLQTLPDNYTEAEGVSKTQRYKALGNGWTVDVLAHIFKNITTN